MPTAISHPSRSKEPLNKHVDNSVLGMLKSVAVMYTSPVWHPKDLAEDVTLRSFSVFLEALETPGIDVERLLRREMANPSHRNVIECEGPEGPDTNAGAILPFPGSGITVHDGSQPWRWGAMKLPASETRELLLKVIDCLDDVVASIERIGYVVDLPTWETLVAEVADYHA